MGKCGVELKWFCHFKISSTVLLYFLRRYNGHECIQQDSLEIYVKKSETTIFNLWLEPYYIPFRKSIHTVGELKDWTKCNLWSKTTLIASSVSGVGVNTPFCKMSTFFHRSLALSVPIYRNFQSNGGKWRSHKLWMKKFI